MPSRKKKATTGTVQASNSKEISMNNGHCGLRETHKTSTGLVPGHQEHSIPQRFLEKPNQATLAGTKERDGEEVPYKIDICQTGNTSSAQLFNKVATAGSKEGGVTRSPPSQWLRRKSRRFNPASSKRTGNLLPTEGATNSAKVFVPDVSQNSSKHLPGRSLSKLLQERPSPPSHQTSQRSTDLRKKVGGLGVIQEPRLCQYLQRNSVKNSARVRRFREDPDEDDDNIQIASKSPPISRPSQSSRLSDASKRANNALANASLVAALPTPTSSSPQNQSIKPHNNFNNNHSKRRTPDGTMALASGQVASGDGCNEISSAQANGSTRHHYGREPDRDSSDHPGWRTYTFLDVFVRNLPQKVTTLMIFKNFERYGSINNITIHANHNHQSASTAIVTFKPVPNVPFWERDGPHQFRVDAKDARRVKEVWLKLSKKQRKNFTVKSPAQNEVVYNEEIMLIGDKIGFGVLESPQSMLVMKTQRSKPDSNVSFTLNLRSQTITVAFPFLLTSSNTTAVRNFRFLIALDQQFNLSELKEANNRSSLILSLNTPPPYSKRLKESINKSHVGDSRRWQEDDAWARQTDIVDIKKTYDVIQETPVSVNKNLNAINIGRWTTFRIDLTQSQQNLDHLRIIKNALRDFNVPVIDTDNFACKQLPATFQPKMWQILENDSTPKKLQSAAAILQATSSTQLPFIVRYQLEVCVSHGCLSEYSIDENFLRQLSDLPKAKAQQFLKVLAVSGRKFYNPMEIFGDLELRKPIRRVRLPENCIEIHHATVTATTMYFNTPSVEITNRIIRQFRQHADRFLRVRFEDDEYRGNTKLFPATNNKMTNVFARVRRALTEGISLGGRHYEFLAWGNSQLREHGVYFFARLKNVVTADHIRAAMGQFDDEKIVAKRAARMGQCFSTTRAIRCRIPRITRHDLIPDVEKGRFKFTDGVGKMSLLVASLAHQQMRLSGPNLPTLIQFRLGGCKGVLAYDPTLRKGIDVEIRKSQFKFSSDSNELEVIRCAQYMSPCLNRQLILVLGELGVSDKILLAKQEALIEEINNAMSNEDDALKALKDHVDPNFMTLVLADVISGGGFLNSNEPFVTSVQRLWRSWTLKCLKEKAKLPVRDGAFVLGSVDETATLRGHFDCQQPAAGASYQERKDALPEIFLQITDPESKEFRVIQGICIVARNPSLHRGDIRVVKAVDVPALHHLRDVVVMPQTGDRDLPSMCSGGDLDGDDYIVIWDAELIPSIWNAPPFHYEAPDPVKAEGQISVSHTISFFVDYMENDFLGRIATAHLAWADDMGLESEQCQELVQLHSLAVDFPKTGVPARLPKRLDRFEWPHFMERKRGSYKSEKILGKLYDAVERVSFEPTYKTPFDRRILDAFKPSEALFAHAQSLKNEYDKSMRQIMAQHQIQTEFEIWSTFVMTHSKASSEYKFHEEIGQLSKALKEQYFEEIVEVTGGRSQEHLAPFAVAAYQITQAEVDKALKSVVENGKEDIDQSEMPFISFPWVLHDVLTKIAAGASTRDTKKSETPSFVNGLMVPGLPGLEYDTDNDAVLQASSRNTGSLPPDWMGQHFSDPYVSAEATNLDNKFQENGFVDREAISHAPILAGDESTIQKGFESARVSSGRSSPDKGTDTTGPLTPKSSELGLREASICEVDTNTAETSNNLIYGDPVASHPKDVFANINDDTDSD